jgi:RNA polymerase-binding transcription factor DksA
MDLKKDWPTMADPCAKEITMSLDETQRSALVQKIEERRIELKRDLTHKGSTVEAHDQDDESTAGLLRELDNAEVQRDRQELLDLDRALERLESEAYGVCVDCGESIPYARLLAEPGALRCIGCENNHERLYSRPKPITG